MIRRANRFHGHNSLNLVYGKGRSVREPRLTLKYALNPNRTNFRLAVVVGKKTSRRAVTRNRIRRRIYEVVRQQSPNIKANYDLVFSVYSDSLADLSHDELVDLITGQLKQAKII